MNRGAALIIALCCVAIAYVMGKQDGFAEAVVTCEGTPIAVHSNPAYVDCIYEQHAPARVTYKKRINRKSH